MLKLIKLISLIFAVIGFFIITGFIFYDNLTLHLTIFIIILIMHSLRCSISESWQMIKLLLPFTITIFIFGLIFQLVHLQGRNDWLYDSLIKVIYFPASFLFTKWMISLFSYQDILGLPLSNELKSDIIFLQVFIKKAFLIMPRLEFYTRMHPLIQNKRGIRRNFLILCAFPLSLYIYLIDEGSTIRHIYLNRLKHLEEL